MRIVLEKVIQKISQDNGINILNNKGKKEKKNIFGGLIIKEGQHFRINMKEEYIGFKENPDDWKYFEEVLK